MKHAVPTCLVLLLLVLAAAPPAQAAEPAAEPAAGADDDRLVILWTSGDKEVFTKVVFPYAVNSKKQSWWKDVTLIVWGPSARLLAGDEELQDQLAQLAEAGVDLTACKWCSDQYEVSDKLNELGVDVKYMGKALTGHLKSEANVMVF